MTLEETSYLYKFSESIRNGLDFLYYFCEDQIEEFNFYTESLDDLAADLKMGFAFSSDDYVEEGIRLLRIGDFTNEVGIEFSNNSVFLPAHFYDDFSQFRVEKGDIVVALTGATIGKAAICESNDRILLNQRILRIRPNKKIAGKFLLCAVQHKFVQLQVLQLSCGGDQPNIGIDALRNLRIPFVNKEKQVLILEQLKPLKEGYISLLNRSTKILSQANKIFLDELGIDLPSKEASYFFKEGKENYSNYYYRFSEQIEDRLHYLFNHPKLEFLDNFKNKYRTVRLKGICREAIKRGKQPEYSNFGVMVIKTVDLKNRFIDYENTLRVSIEFYESKPQAHIRKNDILVSSTGYVSVGKIDVFDLDEPAFADGHVSIVRPNEDYDTYFVTYFLRSALGQIQFEKWFTGSSGQIEVQPEDLNKFILPSKEDISKDRQKEIADKITEEYKKAWNYEQQAKSKRQEAKELFEKLIM